MTSYLGVAQLGTVDIPGGKTPDKSPAEQLAAEMGITLEELMEKLAKWSERPAIGARKPLGPILGAFSCPS